MSEENKTVQSVKKPTTQDFTDAYKKLCEEMGFRFIVNPAFVARDDGSWSIVLQTSVGELPKEVLKPK